MEMTHHRISSANSNMDSKGCVLPPDHCYDDDVVAGVDAELKLMALMAFILMTEKPNPNLVALYIYSVHPNQLLLFS